MNILIAEDDADIRHLVREILEEEGHACVEAGDGLEAQAALRTVENFDLLFSDLGMPHMGGAELLHWCRNQGIDLPVVLMTANPDLLAREKLNLHETNAALLSKPVDIADILNAVITAKKNQLAKAKYPTLLAS